MCKNKSKLRPLRNFNYTRFSTINAGQGEMNKLSKNEQAGGAR